MRASSGSCATVPRTVYLAFDADANGSGQQAAQWLSRRLREQGITARRVSLPDGPRSQQLLRSAVAMPTSSNACWRRRAMSFQVIHQPDPGQRTKPLSHCRAPTGREVEWVNRFLDRE